MSSSFGFGVHHGGPRRLIQHFGEGQREEAVRFGVLFQLLRQLKPYWLWMLSAFLLMVLSSGLAMAVPYLLKRVIDVDIAGRDSRGLIETALVVLACFTGIFLTSSLQRYLLSWVGQKVLSDLRGRLFVHLQDLSLSYHDRHSSGVTISTIINDVAVIKELLSSGLITLIGDLLLLGGIVVIMLTMNAQLALFCFSVIPVMIVITLLFARRARVAFRRTRSRVAAVVSDLAENLTGMRIIQAFSQEQLTQDRFDRINRRSRDAHISAISLSFIFIPAVEFLSVLAMGIVLYFGGRAVVGGAVTVGLVVAFLSYVTRFFQPLQELGQIFATLQAAIAGGDRVLALLNTPSAVADHPQAAALGRIRGEICLQDVHFSYDERKPVLKGISLRVEPGQTVAIVGPTGAGKTSIINLIARFYDVQKGSVLIDGRDVRTVTQQSLRGQLGIVNQDPFLFSGTVRENICFAGPFLDEKKLARAAKLAHADHFIRRLPNGYDTRVFRGGITLSAGQRQLIAIARALYADPRVIILDEATSSVDTLTEQRIQQGLKALFKGRTAVVIAHRLSTVRNADKIYLIENGRVSAEGRHEELLSGSRLYRDLYERQFVKRQGKGK